MKTIWKFPLNILGKNTVLMPLASSFVHVGVQQGVVHVWAEVDPDTTKRARVLHIAGTGWSVEESWDHIGSVQDGEYVWHVYEDYTS